MWPKDFDELAGIAKKLELSNDDIAEIDNCDYAIFETLSDCDSGISENDVTELIGCAAGIDIDIGDCFAHPTNKREYFQVKYINNQKHRVYVKRYSA